MIKIGENLLDRVLSQTKSSRLWEDSKLIDVTTAEIVEVVGSRISLEWLYMSRT